jgi:hypothetical protein
MCKVDASIFSLQTELAFILYMQFVKHNVSVQENLAQLSQFAITGIWFVIGLIYTLPF